MCAGKEEEEVTKRLLCQAEEQANIFLHSCCNIIFHLKTTLFQLIFNIQWPIVVLGISQSKKPLHHLHRTISQGLATVTSRAGSPLLQPPSTGMAAPLVPRVPWGCRQSAWCRLDTFFTWSTATALSLEGRPCVSVSSRTGLWHHGSCCSVSQVFPDAGPCCALTLTEDQGLLANIPLMCLEGTGGSSQVEVPSVSLCTAFSCELPARPGDSASISLELSVIRPALPNSGQDSQAELPPLWEFLTFFYCEDEIIVIA